MNDWVVHFVQAGGYWGIAFLMMLENLFPPIPSELIMGIGGLALARGTMSFTPLLFAGTVGATAGNYILFLIADRLGFERLKPLIVRWERWVTLEWEDIEKAGHFMRAHGQWVVFIMRFMPMFRTTISLPAGLAHMSHWKFIVYTFLGAGIWNTLLILGGQWLGHSFAQADKWITWGAIAGGVAGVVWYLWRVLRWRPRRARVAREPG
ncbi:DedA family protein [Novosphingobium sp. 9]|uniref:DedA family protein n=1 Tax=Novosphingobium sp. 9 TaxID=2025349 RepID=UPI0021B6E497|nr:DedA family protein [Novosphingobium sp. 9]